MTSRPQMIALALPIFSLTVPSLLAHCGPGTTGAPISLGGGQLFVPGGPTGADETLAWRIDTTDFEDLADAELEARARTITSGHREIEAIERSVIHTLTWSRRVARDFELGISLGWYRASGLRIGELHGGHFHLDPVGEVEGLTDFWITGRRTLPGGGRKGRTAIYGGLKLPFGRDDVVGDGRTASLEASMQPGNGGFEALLGISVARNLRRRTTAHASLDYTVKSPHAGFEIGDRLAVGVGFSHLLPEGRAGQERWSLVLELLWLDQEENWHHGHRIQGSGGQVLFLSPGLRGEIGGGWGLIIQPQFPIMQDWNGVQPEVESKATVAVTRRF